MPIKKQEASNKIKGQKINSKLLFIFIINFLFSILLIYFSLINIFTKNIELLANKNYNAISSLNNFGLSNTIFGGILIYHGPFAISVSFNSSFWFFLTYIPLSFGILILCLSFIIFFKTKKNLKNSFTQKNYRNYWIFNFINLILILFANVFLFWGLITSLPIYTNYFLIFSLQNGLINVKDSNFVSAINGYWIPLNLFKINSPILIVSLFFSPLFLFLLLQIICLILFFVGNKELKILRIKNSENNLKPYKNKSKIKTKKIKTEKQDFFETPLLYQAPEYASVGVTSSPMFLEDSNMNDYQPKTYISNIRIDSETHANIWTFFQNQVSWMNLAKLYNNLLFKKIESSRNDYVSGAYENQINKLCFGIENFIEISTKSDRDFVSYMLSASSDISNLLNKFTNEIRDIAFNYQKSIDSWNLLGAEIQIEQLFAIASNFTYSLAKVGYVIKNRFQNIFTSLNVENNIVDRLAKAKTRGNYKIYKEIIKEAVISISPLKSQIETMFNSGYLEGVK
ncbi:hypothetical protein [Spiroplasma endosymbiont of Labia minor]|uniref:hypothetical protein n=1 Tax=Spiroplasma endosymbiont of Labia minor TaxID=3066305 RepID=UPI0030D06F40